MENSVIDGWAVGISQEGGAATELFVKDSTLRNNSNGLYAATGATSADNVRFLNNNLGFAAEATVSVRGSTLSGNTTAGIIAGAGSSVTVEKCQVTGNGTGITLPAASGSTVRLSRSVVSGNTLGLENVGGTLEVSGNNVVRGNATDASGTISPVGLQ